MRLSKSALLGLSIADLIRNRLCYKLTKTSRPKNQRSYRRVSIHVSDVSQISWDRR